MGEQTEGIKRPHWGEIYREFEERLKEGKLSSCSTAELMKYIEAISNTVGGPPTVNMQRGSYLQTLTTLYNAKVMEAISTENTKAMKAISFKNSILTYVVIALAIVTTVFSCLTYFGPK